MDTAKVALDALNPAPIATNDRGPPPKFESPSPKVVLEVKDLLFKTFKLPLEIVDVIIDYAEYWPRTTVTTSGRTFRVGGSESDKLIVCIETLYLLIYSPFWYIRTFELIVNSYAHSLSVIFQK